jgi:RNA polymerase sigma factor (sigma-70 family)
MAGSTSREVLRHLNTLFHCGTVAHQSDEELLERFVAGRDEGAEAAFAALVERHGAMVLGVCRRVLGDQHAAEDAFQATFLVLAKKAAAIAHKEQLASWLYGVARRAALDARARSTRRQAREKRLDAMLPAEPNDHAFTSELRSILDEELARLPERHRAAIVLCELEGLSRREAAVRLGVSEGTLSSRLARAKSRLRERLTRRGLALTAVTLSAILSQDAQAVSVPPALIDSTIRGATKVAAGSSLTGVVSTSVATLTEGVLKAMLIAKLKGAVLGVAALAVITTGVGVLAQDGPSSDDRLKAVERKLDRLIEMFGVPKRSASAPAQALTPVPVADPTVPPPPAPPAAAAAPAAAAPVVAASAGLGPGPRSGPVAAYPVPPAAPGMVMPPVQPGSASPPFAAPRASSSTVERRIRSLEERLSGLERRFAELERRLPHVGQNPGQRGRGRSSADVLPALAAPAPDTRPVLPPSLPDLPTPPADEPPSPDTAPAPTLGAPGIPSADTAPAPPSPPSPF